MAELTKTLAELAATLGAKLSGDPSAAITDVASIEDAGPGQITFAADKRSLNALSATRASAVVVKEGSAPVARVSLIEVKDPLKAFAKLIAIFRPEAAPSPGVHPKAEVHAGAVIASTASIGAFSVVEDGARIGENAAVHPRVYIGAGAEIGDGSILYPGVVVRDGCCVGKNVIIHPNAVIGSDGFGYYREGASYKKIPQRGIVVIEDGCEIGACVTIDRATVGATLIGRGTKIDNLVQIAHNVKVGEDTVIVAQAGIAGSARIGSRVQLAGQAGINGHIEVGDDSIVTAKTGVIGSIPPRSVVSGMPAIPHGEWMRAEAVFTKLPEIKKRIAGIEERLSAIEGKAKKGS